MWDVGCRAGVCGWQKSVQEKNGLLNNYLHSLTQCLKPWKEIRTQVACQLQYHIVLAVISSNITWLGQTGNLKETDQTKHASPLVAEYCMLALAQ
jgi:hypothetical protein